MTVSSFTELPLTGGNLLFYWLLLPALKIGIVMAILPLLIAVATYAERKVIAFIQVRLGPMRVGPRGILQPIADVLKLLLKEDITPSASNKIVFTLAPMIVLIPAFIVYSVIPFGPEFAWAESFPTSLLKPVAMALGADIQANIPLYITDLNIGLLFIVAVSSIGALGLLLAGWASNSKYPLLGGLRSAAQLISYEVPMGFALVGALMMLGSLSMTGIIKAQQDLGLSLWLLQPVGLFLYFLAGVAETNRVPFDLPEAETELVAGFHTEYSGMRFAFFFLAEYANMITVAAVASTVFLGGWLPPFHGLLTHAVAEGGRVPHAWAAFLFSPLLAFFWLTLKILFFYALYYWFRATFPRYRFDQLMGLGWKWLIPLSIANVFLIGVSVVLMTAWKLPAWCGIGFAAVDILAILTTLYIVRSSKDKADEEVLEAA